MTEATARREWWKIVLVTVPAIVVIGWLMGVVSDSGGGNGWYDGLAKPAFQPPGWAFGVVWTILYILMGISVALIIAEPPSPHRRTALTLFFFQLALNFAWSPIFFGGRMIEVGLVTIIVMLLGATAAANLFRRLRPVAGWLMLPYLAWLCLATALNYETGKLNPGADSAPLGIIGD